MSPSLLNITPELTASVATKTAAVKALLTDIAGHWSPAAFANSLGAEDMVLTDLIVKAKLPIEIFSLDTGRLPPETYDLMAAVHKHYGLKLKVYFPQAEEVESYVRQHGINAFYDSVTLRKACCYARKVEPLNKLLEARTQLSNLLTYMDGKNGAEELIAKILQDPTLLKSLSQMPKNDESAKGSEE